MYQQVSASRLTRTQNGESKRLPAEIEKLSDDQPLTVVADRGQLVASDVILRLWREIRSKRHTCREQAITFVCAIYSPLLVLVAALPSRIDQVAGEAVSAGHRAEAGRPCRIFSLYR